MSINGSGVAWYRLGTAQVIEGPARRRSQAVFEPQEAWMRGPLYLRWYSSAKVPQVPTAPADDKIAMGQARQRSSKRFYLGALA
ncbi:hypothetical protein HJFPF1_04954 [Paramyrothecium foliicola]|nr:hypothetical protein HJFPF1_04954 [Paramyrothecium foliicola]